MSMDKPGVTDQFGCVDRVHFGRYVNLPYEIWAFERLEGFTDWSLRSVLFFAD